MIEGSRLRWVMAAATYLMGALIGLEGMKPAQSASPEAAALKNTIILGRVSSNPRKTYPRLERMVGYLVHRLKPLGITRGKVVIAKNNRKMMRLLRSGRVDFLSETVMTALYFEKNAQAEIMLREWKKNTGWYWNIIFT